MKKKILFMMINMNIGGTEKALLNMLEEIDEKKYNVTVMMLEEYGGFLNDIPNWVKIKYFENYSDIKEILNMPPQVTIKKLIKQWNFIDAFNIAYIHLLSKIKKERSIFFEYVLKNYKNIDEEYDLAVAYAGPMDFISYYVINKIKAKKKIQWIHFDVTKIGFNKVFAEKVYSKFDKIFVVSNEAKNKLDNLVPSLKYKTEVFFNIISPKTMTKMAKESIGFDDDFDGIRILTVGRLAEEKGQDLTIPVLAKLKEEGYNVRWYCIGEGNLRLELEELIRKYKLEKDYILLGSNSNPYPFMKDCDRYVQPSRYEGYCITTLEVKYFNKVIIATEVNGMNEQIKNNINGLIAKISSDSIYKNIKLLLDDEQKKKKIIENLKKEEVDTGKAIVKLFV